MVLNYLYCAIIIASYQQIQEDTVISEDLLFLLDYYIEYIDIVKYLYYQIEVFMCISSVYLYKH